MLYVSLDACYMAYRALPVRSFLCTVASQTLVGFLLLGLWGLGSQRHIIIF